MKEVVLITCTDLFLVDLCHPLLVGVLTDEEEDVQRTGGGSSKRREVFLCVKQGLALEVDVQHGRERCRLELSSLARVEAREAAWTRGVKMCLKSHSVVALQIRHQVHSCVCFHI